MDLKNKNLSELELLRKYQQQTSVKDDSESSPKLKGPSINKEEKSSSKSLQVALTQKHVNNDHTMQVVVNESQGRSEK